MMRLWQAALGVLQAIPRMLAVLKPSWLAAFIIFVTSALLQSSQALDVLSEVVEDGFLSWHHAFLALTLALLSICGWYFPRALLYVNYWNTPAPSSPAEERRFEPYRRWVPRLLGVLPILSVAVAYFREYVHRHDGHSLLFFSLFYAVLAVGFWVFVVLRRRLFLGGAPVTLVGPALSWATILVLLCLLTLSSVLLLLFLYSPVTAPRFIGSAAIAIYAGAAWVAFGCLALIYPTYRYQIPSLVSALIVLAAIFGLWNDNHKVRDGDQAPLPWVRETVTTHLQGWLQFREAMWTNRAKPYPVFVVSAEGGGIRAAYWTALVLARLEDTNPGFACHLFAISGASGGSLGGAVFSALVADSLNEDKYSCDGGERRNVTALLPKAKQILGEDFLAPTLAGMLFPDLMQRFSPFYGALAFPDRAKYLEMAWEQAWKDGAGSNRFAEIFQTLWQQANHAYQVPSLFLNGTWVETGERNATSNLKPNPVGFARLDDAVSVLDKPIRLSTAVHMSARFTYVSPAGTVQDTGKTRHVVDGGYYENSGAMTASEIISVIQDYLDEYCQAGPAKSGTCVPPNILPIALIISNDPNNPNNPRRPPGVKGSTHQLLSETLSPLRTLFNTRGERGYAAESFLKQTAGDKQTIRFQLMQDGNAKLPLGWMLSAGSQEEIKGQVITAREYEDVRNLLTP